MTLDTEETVALEDLTERLMDALVHVQKATHERDKAEAETECDWGYYGRQYEQNLKDAQGRFSNILCDFVDKRLDQRLVALGLKN
jgi:hypothetical protein